MPHSRTGLNFTTRFFSSPENHCFSFPVRLLIASGILIVPLLADPIAYQSFREPKMLVLIEIGAIIFFLWGVCSLVKGVTHGDLLLPPAPFAALLVPILQAAFLLQQDLSGLEGTAASDPGIPLLVAYHVHILLPVISCFLCIAACSWVFRSAGSRSFLGLLVLIVLSFESVIVALELVQNMTGIELNPVEWFGKVETSGQILKERLFGTIGNPNFLAGFFAVSILPALAWTLGTRKLHGRVFGIFVLILSAFLMVITRSKGALLAAGLGLSHFVIVAALQGRLCFRWRVFSAPHRVLRFSSLVGLFLIVLGVGFLVADRVTSPMEEKYLNRWVETLHLEGDSVSVRALLAWTGFRMWESHPWLGWGPGGFKVNFLPTLREGLETGHSEILMSRITRLHSLRANHLHNEYLQTLVEWGVIGLAFFELFAVWCEICGLKRIRETQCRSDYWMRLGLLSGVWSGLGGSFFDLPLHRPAQAFLLSVLLGSSLSRQKPHRISNNRRPRVLWRSFSVLVGFVAIGAGCWMLLQSPLRYVALRNAFWAQAAIDGKIPMADPEKTFNAVRKATLNVPGEGDYAFLLARYYLEVENNPTKAISQLRRVSMISDHPGRFLLEARAQIERRNIPAAEPLLSFVEDLDPNAPGLHDLKGRVWEAKGEFTKAVESYQAEVDFWKSSNLPPNRDVIHSYRRLAALAEERLHDFELAAAYYNQLLELQKVSGERYPYAELRLAQLYRNHLFDPDSALENLERALDKLARMGLSQEAENVRSQICRIRESQTFKGTEP